MKTPEHASPPALSVMRSEPLIITLTPSDEAGWRLAVVRHPVDDRRSPLPARADELLDSTGSTERPNSV